MKLRSRPPRDPATTAVPDAAAVPRRSSQPDIPLWNEVLQEEASLRPRVDALAAARRTPPSLTLRAASVAVVVAAVVAWALLLQRQQLVLARDSRPPKLRGAEVRPYAEFVSPGGALLAWQNIAAALGCGFALWLLLSLLPSTRNFAMRWTWVPVVTGAAAWLGTQWYLMVMVP